MNEPAIHYQSIRDRGKMFVGGMLLKHGIKPGKGGSNLCVAVLVCKKGRLVGLAHRAQKNNTEKQRRKNFIDGDVGFRFSPHAVKIRISVIYCFTVKLISWLWGNHLARGSYLRCLRPVGENLCNLLPA